MSIRLGIVGYGNLGKGVEYAVSLCDDITLTAVFTRRDPKSVKLITENVPVYSVSDAIKFKDDIDVLILCGGSATDLPLQSPEFASSFNIVDSFDTHAKIPEHFKNVNSASLNAQKTSAISAGWDPGLFSIARLYSSAILPQGESYTFWGRGVSQGHSDAIRRIEGVIDARQYTVPSEEALTRVRNGEQPCLTTREKHSRECFVVAAENADKERIASEIKNMPNYFADYNTTVHFISMEELKRDHMGMPHGGSVIRSGKTGENNQNTHIVEYSLNLDSNPEFTSSVLVAVARAVCRLYKENKYGCYTMLDIPPAYLSPLSDEELRRSLL